VLAGAAPLAGVPATRVVTKTVRPRLEACPVNFAVRRLNVPRYEVTVQGRGIVVPIGTSLAVGFLRIVQVRAADPVEAEIRAVELVGSEWPSSSHRRLRHRLCGGCADRALLDGPAAFRLGGR